MVDSKTPELGSRQSDYDDIINEGMNELDASQVEQFSKPDAVAGSDLYRNPFFLVLLGLVIVNLGIYIHYSTPNTEVQTLTEANQEIFDTFRGEDIDLNVLVDLMKGASESTSGLNSSFETPLQRLSTDLQQLGVEAQDLPTRAGFRSSGSGIYWCSEK